MFKGFSGVWTVALSASALKKRPVSVVIAGERLVFFRDSTGKAQALSDQCPHRGVRLSLGKVEGDCLRCPFHGWTFAGDGQVRNVPWNPDAKLQLLRANAFPVQEQAGLVFVHTAPVSEHAPPPLVLPPTLLRSDVTHCMLEVTWKTHWTRAMENMLDWPHLPFVHQGTIGRGMVKELSTNGRMDVDIEPTPTGLSSTIRLADKPQPGGGLDFCKPNIMVLHIMSEPKKIFVMHVAVVPVDDSTTRMIVINTRGFLRASIFNWLFVLSNRRIVGEDKAVVESSFPMRVPAPGTELSVRTDKLTLQFRKYWFDELREPEQLS